MDARNCALAEMLARRNEATPAILTSAKTFLPILPPRRCRHGVGYGRVSTDRLIAGANGLRLTGTRNACAWLPAEKPCDWQVRSEEHTSELQSLKHLVSRLLLEQK